MPDIYGHVVENFVAIELLKLNTFSTISSELMHFHTSDGIEVDFILERTDQYILGIEVKKREHVSMKDFKGLEFLQSELESKFIAGYVLYSGKNIIPFGKYLWAMPMSLL